MNRVSHIFVYKEGYLLLPNFININLCTFRSLMVSLLFDLHKLVFSHFMFSNFMNLHEVGTVLTDNANFTLECVGEVSLHTW